MKENIPFKILENHPADSRVKYCEDNVFQTLSSRMGTGGGNVPMIEENAVVRRLTPMECERLQGYPDGWTDIGEWVDSKGKQHKDADSPRYKALGNSIALPFWEWMARRMVKYIDHKPTMASLFDGIGGFPLVYSRAGCEPVWASEIEEFPIAVTKKHFPDTEIYNETNDILAARKTSQVEIDRTGFTAGNNQDGTREKKYLNGGSNRTRERSRGR